MTLGKTGTSKTPKPEKDSGIYAAFLQNESALKRFLRRFLYKQEDIDEISQETFLRAYKATKGREIDSPNKTNKDTNKQQTYKNKQTRTGTVKKNLKGSEI